MRNRLRQFFGVLWIAVSFGPALAFGQDPFAAQVRPTDPLTPALEQKSFHLPPGFEAQLFASEPEILKPLNMAFDARGRLWVTESQEYPYAAPADRPGRDHIKILEDTDGDGRADKITTFADGLNIPIGIYPYRDGCIVFSIPYIWRLRDTDGDGRCDQREKLFGPMGVDRDTHGLNNAFRRGFDGWLYACHGFNNHTEVAGKDGHKIAMQSGNTYRMKLDGSRIEHFTHGQVNPFGMTFDEWGNQFTADCHSKPLTQLLRGAFYPSFGKPHDGLGFVSPMMNHSHSSTAIAGVAYPTGESFPADFRRSFFSGNVMTSRINRNALVFHGSTIRAKEEPDFLNSDDPWFRPVDLRIGPDGAMYIADFYNRIIGHYEVPLDHPGRDRRRGRIWRIVYTGNKAGSRDPQAADLSKAGTDDLIKALADPNLTVRQLATDQLSDRIGKKAVPKLQDALANSQSPEAKAHTLWVLYRLDGLNEDLLTQAAADQSPLVRTHAMKVLAETPEWSEKMIESVRKGLSDSNAFVQRAAADAFGQHPEVSAVADLLTMLPKIPPADDHLRYMVRMAIRNQLRRKDAFAELQNRELSEVDLKELEEIALAIDSPESAAFVLDCLTKLSLSGERLAGSLEHAVRYLPAEQTDRLVHVARQKCGDDWDLQFRLLAALHAGLERRGEEATPLVRSWAQDVAKEWISDLPPEALAWANTPLASEANPANPWAVQERVSADGDTASRFLCSLPFGEQLTGRLASREFALPASLSFYVAGHIGPPNKPVVAKNFIRLIDAETHAVLKETQPPRNDTAQRITWDLKEFAGRRGYVEIIDGDTRRAYAWLAVGRFEPNVVPIAAASPREVEDKLQTTASLAAEYGLADLRPTLAALLKEDPLPAGVSAAMIRALGKLAKQPQFEALAVAAEDPVVPHSLRRTLNQTAAEPDQKAVLAAMTAAFRQCPARLQTGMAEALANDAAGRQIVFTLIEKGVAPARLLLNPPLRARLLATAKSESERQALEQTIKSLTASLPAANEAIEKLLQTRRAAYPAADHDANRGEAVFKKHCAACHQVGGQGAVVGPQLDGIGNRGLERVLEDVLDPNRNVDVAFRTTTVALEDGTVHTGLVRRDEGAVRVLVDQKGKEFSIRRDQIVQERKSNLSLMPANVAELVPEKEFYDLVAFLLARRSSQNSAENRAPVPKP